jgi:hypothetical protein
MSGRVASAMFGAAIIALAVHVFLILSTGGYAVGIGGVAIGGHAITRPIMLLLALVVACLVVCHRGALSDVFRSHASLIVFSAILVVYLANGKTIGSGDTVPAKFLPLTILREGNFDLDEFPFLFDREKFPFPYFLRSIGGHYVSDYPVAPALLALPVYLPSSLGHVDAQSPLIDELEKLSAAIIVALSAVVLHGTLRRLTSPAYAVFITAVYAFGTSSLSESCQALWQHGPSQLALAVTLYCLMRARERARWAALAGFPLAFAIISRPTDVLLAVPLGLYVLVYHRRQLAGFLLAGLPPALFQLGYNAAYFGDPLRIQFFSTLSAALGGLPRGAASASWSTPLGVGLAGILISPARGLLVYSPMFLLSAVGAVLAWKKGGDRLIGYASTGIVPALLLYSKWDSWWGGTSYGPRLLADLSPILALCLIPLGPLIPRMRALRVAVAVLAGWSVGAHAIGAFVDDRTWNADVNVDSFPERLWSWTDNQLVNPPREALVRALAAASTIPTSKTVPGLLGASYRVHSPANLTLDACKSVPLVFEAINDGHAVWLGQGQGDGGQVSVAWQWRQGDQLLPSQRGRSPLRLSVLPGQSYPVWESTVAPAEAGHYLLEVGLVGEDRAWLSTPVRIHVDVAPAPPVPAPGSVDLVSNASPAPGGGFPRFELSVDRRRYESGDTLRLSFAESVGPNAWLVDAYLLLRGPGGSLQFYDGRKLTGPGRCGWQPLIRATRLVKGRRSAGPLLTLPLAGMPEGAYSWRLLVTDVDRYRMIGETRADFEVSRAGGSGRDDRSAPRR